jgi:hypothetical protein
MAVQEGAVVISPHEGPFRAKQRDFLDGIRHIPASIINPPGLNPYSAALGSPGRWIFVWVPEKVASGQVR